MFAWIVWDDTAPLPSLLIFSFTIFLFKCLLFCAASSRSVTQRTIRQEERLCTLHNETVRELRLCVIVPLSNNQPTANLSHTVLLVLTQVNKQHCTKCNSLVGVTASPQCTILYLPSLATNFTSTLMPPLLILQRYVTLPFRGLYVAYEVSLIALVTRMLLSHAQCCTLHFSF